MGSPEPEAPGPADGWLKRPFARTFDLISAEYGWTDPQILDLTLGRMRQIRDVIRERDGERLRRDVSLMETQTQYICSFVASSAGNGPGAREALKIRFLDDTAETTAKKQDPRVAHLPGNIDYDRLPETGQIAGMFRG